jgi:ribosome biogenesis GTPase
VLSRPDSGPGGGYVERVIAANVDRVVVVAAARQPPLRPRLLDRYLVAIEHGGASAAIAINKTDLLDDTEREELLSTLEPYHALGVPLVACSVADGSGIDELGEVLRGELAVFVGQSGVGKSSLLNALQPELEIATQTPSRSNKGRHTTTASTLHRLACGTRIIDTPGVREFGLWQLTAAELGIYFHEFDEPALRCHYRDCIHAHEPECGVRDAAMRGEIPAGRYDSYRRLLATVARS